MMRAACTRSSAPKRTARCACSLRSSAPRRPSGRELEGRGAREGALEPPNESQARKDARDRQEYAREYKHDAAEHLTPLPEKRCLERKRRKRREPAEHTGCHEELQILGS